MDDFLRGGASASCEKPTYLRGAIRKVCYCVLRSNMYNRLSARQLKHVAFSAVSVGSKVLCNCSLLFYHLKRLVISIGELTDLSHAILTVPPILNNAHVLFTPPIRLAKQRLLLGLYWFVCRRLRATYLSAV